MIGNFDFFLCLKFFLSDKNLSGHVWSLVFFFFFFFLFCFVLFFVVVF